MSALQRRHHAASPHLLTALSPPCHFSLLVMANKGPNTNGSQWFVTLRACPHLDGKHVVFGRVLRGFEIIQAIAAVETDDKDRPLQPVVVTNCGELVRKAAEGTFTCRCDFQCLI